MTDGVYSGTQNEEIAAEKNVRLVTTNLTGREAEDILADFEFSEDFKKQSRFRNGVETIPSILRRKYGIDKIPVRGLIRSRFFFGCKIGALNIKKFCRYMQDEDKDKCGPKMVTA